MKHRQNLSRFTLLPGIALCLSASALAQSPQQATATGDQNPGRPSAAQTVMENIVVTARKRSQGEFSQDVPISLTAVSGDQIEAFKDLNLMDVGNRIPNVRLDDSGVFPGVASYSVRGMGVFSTIS